jgi:predicted trehalose synthase
MQERHRSKQSAQLEERMAEEAVRLRKQAQGTPPGVERERLIRRARQAETAAQLSEWLRSSGLRPPR